MTNKTQAYLNQSSHALLVAPSPFLVSTNGAIMCLYMSSTHTVVAPIYVTLTRTNLLSWNVVACFFSFLLSTFPMANTIVNPNFGFVIARMIWATNKGFYLCRMMWHGLKSLHTLFSQFYAHNLPWSLEDPSWPHGQHLNDS